MRDRGIAKRDWVEALVSRGRCVGLMRRISLILILTPTLTSLSRSLSPSFSLSVPPLSLLFSLSVPPLPSFSHSPSLTPENHRERQPTRKRLLCFSKADLRRQLTWLHGYGHVLILIPLFEEIERIAYDVVPARDGKERDVRALKGD